MNMRHLITTSLLCAFSLLLSDAQNNLIAQEKPLKINGSGVILGDVLFAPNASAPHIATGRGTAGLGRYHGIGVVQVNDPATGEFSSAVPFEFMKNGNGDILAMHYGRTDPESGASPPAESPGIVMLLPGDKGMFIAVWLAEFNPVPSACTGKFERVVSGSLTMLAVTDSFVLGDPKGVPFIPAGTGYSWEGEGKIEFQR